MLKMVYKKRLASVPKEIDFNDESQFDEWLDFNTIYCFNLYRIENGNKVWIKGGIV